MSLMSSMGIARRLWTAVIVLSLALAALACFAYVKLNDVVEAAPSSVRDLGNRVVNQLVGVKGVNGNGSNGATVNGTTSNGTLSMDDMAVLFPQLMQLAERYVPADDRQVATVDEVLAMLNSRVSENEKPLLAKGHQAVAMFPFIGGSRFADMYARYQTMK